MSEPLVSFVMATLRARDARPTLECLAAQTVVDQAEVIVVAPEPEASVLPLPVTWVQREFASRGRAAAYGIQHSRGRYLALVENHAFPDPNWAESLITELESQGAAGACGVFRPANPKTVWSRVDALLYYGAFSQPTPTTETVARLPRHNVIYRRALLEALGDRLTGLLECEDRLQDAFKSSGHSLLFCPQTGFAHLNSSGWRNALRTCWEFGRAGAVVRSAPWPTWRKWLQAAFYPVYLPRRWRLLPQRPSPDLAAVVALALLAACTGEAFGYLAGPSSFGWCMRHELDPSCRLGPRELARWRSQ